MSIDSSEILHKDFTLSNIRQIWFRFRIVDFPTIVYRNSLNFDFTFIAYKESLFNKNTSSFNPAVIIIFLHFIEDKYFYQMLQQFVQKRARHRMDSMLLPFLLYSAYRLVKSSSVKCKDCFFICSCKF